jgi:serine/threonine-protein kinase
VQSPNASSKPTLDATDASDMRDTAVDTGATIPVVKPPAASPASSTLSGADTAVASSFVAVDPVAPSADGDGFESRYEVRELLGEGGMGAVRLFKDKLIGREVAMKAIHPGHGSRSDLRMRFVREARVQGQLEHPSIVPVYDLSLRPEPAFFTMKRVRGVTLEQVIAGVRAGDAEMVSRFSRRRLLTAYDSVCLAVDFAHVHGVVHRDLKPANIMLGHFGEVYVLDWGIARVGAADPGDVALARSGESFAIDTAGDGNAKTEVGALMGTLGYMAPEQVRGDALDARADVYALGAILFELLALAPLHPGPSATAIVTSTLTGSDARPSVRAPDREVPPELEAICVRATALAPEGRYASARELHDAVEQFLDGDRDLEMRAKMATGHARAAAEAADRSMVAVGKASDAERSAALREVGRALALDPANPDALRTTLALRMQPPRELPEEAKATLEVAHDEMLGSTAFGAMLWYASTLLYFPFFLWMGKCEVPLAALSYTFLLLAALTSAVVWRRPSARWGIVLAFSLSTAGFATLSRVLGPYMLLPAILVGNSVAFVVTPGKNQRRTALVVGMLGLIVPVALEILGVLSPSYAFRDGGMTVLPHGTALPETPTLVLLFTITLSTIATAVLFVDRVRRSLDRAEQRLHLQAWQLRQLVPDAAKGAGEVALAPQVHCGLEEISSALRRPAAGAPR